mgnify:CR=1 FL=1|tara:strand:+ start:597 stop:1022 length:426 start_codon:yes stop_codon:yes gene_type:complete
MAVKKLKAVSPDKLLNKGADMKPVTTGQMNNQVIPQVNADIATISTTTIKNQQQINEVSELATTANEAAAEASAAAGESSLKLLLACNTFTSCAEAAEGGVAPGQLFSLVKTFKIQNGEETLDCSIPVVVCMPLDCEGTCW